MSHRRTLIALLLLGGAIAVGTSAAIAAIAYAAFVLGGWWVPVVPVVLGTAIGAIAIGTYAHYQWREESFLGILHGLNNPNNSIRQNAIATIETLQKAPEGAIDKKLKEQILREAKSIRECSRQIEVTANGFVFSHRGQAAIQGSLNHWLVEMVKSIFSVQELQVTLQFDLDAELDKERELSRAWPIIFNALLENAIDSLAEKNRAIGYHFKPRIEISTRMEEGGAIAVEIRDNGSGIEPKLLQRGRLFEAYRSSKGPGRGLGLAEAMRASKLAGLNLSVESATGEGSFACFRIQTSSKNLGNKSNQRLCPGRILG